jgi:hypothetical protein
MLDFLVYFLALVGSLAIIRFGRNRYIDIRNKRRYRRNITGY